MKKFFLYASMLFAAMALALTGCKEPEPEPIVPEPPTPVELTFEVDIDSVTKSSVTYSVTPSVKDADYLVVLVPETYIDQAGMGDALATALLESIRQQAASTGKTLAEYLPDVMSKGDTNGKELKGLAPDTDYSLVVFGMDAELKASTEPVCVPFTTEAVQPVDCTFDVTAEVFGTTVDLTVKPSTTEIHWHMFIITDSDYAAYTDPAGNYQFDAATLYEAYLASEVNSYLEAGYTYEEVLAGLFIQGDAVLTAKNLNANTDYRYMVAGVLIEDGEAYIVTAPSSEVFTTGEPLASDMTFEITVENVEMNRADIKIVPSNETETFTWFCSTYDGVSTNTEILDTFLAQNKMFLDWGMMLYSGIQDFTEAGPNYKYKVSAPDTDHYVFAVGYAGGVTTAPEFAFFRTLPAPDPADVTFQMNTSDVTPYSAVLLLDSSDDTTYYTVGMTVSGGCDLDAAIADAESGLEEMLQMQQMFNPGATMLDVLSTYYYSGDYSIAANSLTPESNYDVFVLAFSTEGKVVAHELFENAVTTPAIGNISPSIELIGYYDGNEENGALFGQPEATKNKCIMVVKYADFDGATALYAATMTEEYADAEAKPDSSIIKALPFAYWSKINLNAPYSFYVADWEMAQVACAFAHDANGVMGTIGRLPVQPSVEAKGSYADLEALVNQLNSSSSVAPKAAAYKGNTTMQPTNKFGNTFLKKSTVEALPYVPEHIARPTEVNIEIAKPAVDMSAPRILSTPYFVRVR